MQQAATRENTVDQPTSVYLLRLEPVRGRIRVELGGEVVAESDRALVLHEARLVPVYYFPREDVRMELLRPADHETHCPFKGMASYWDVRAGGREAMAAAWSYEDPFEEAAEVKDRIAFYWDRMDRWTADGQETSPPPRDRVPAHVNPLMEWLIAEAWESRSVDELFEKLADCLIDAGIPLDRMRLVIRTLHPQLYGRAYTWSRDADEIDVLQATYEIMEQAAFLNSPFAAIIDGASGMRRRLDVDDPQLDYPVLEDLLAEGFTDYVAMPMTFSDGQINVISVSSMRPGGFSTTDLGNLYEIMPLISRLFESHYMRSTAVTLLDTYLGRQTGQRVLEGRIQRGDGDKLYAVIWFCDLRDSTALSESMSREDYLAMLNQFLEAMADAVLDAGGEVLRYIGDAALAIFPISGDVGLAAPVAARAAADAARDAVRRMETVNAARAERGETPIGYGIGLHLGDVTYGNIGAPSRLEFTVIGAAANEAARIESLTKELDTPVAISARFDQCYPAQLVSLGTHRLKGIAEEQEIFTLPPVEQNEKS